MVAAVVPGVGVTRFEHLGHYVPMQIYGWIL